MTYVDLDTLWLFMGTELLLSITPGPAVMLVIGASLRHGFKVGFWSSAGVLLTNALMFTLSALGVGAIIVASAVAFSVLKVVGGIYLIYLGLNMMRPLLKRLRGHSRSADLKPTDALLDATPPPISQLVWRGFSVQASNPKNLAFFVAILPQFVSPDGNVALQLAVLGVISVLLELPVLALYGAVAAWSASAMRHRMMHWVEGVGGGALVLIGGRLVMARRPS